MNKKTKIKFQDYRMQGYFEDLLRHNVSEKLAVKITLMKFGQYDD